MIKTELKKGMLYKKWDFVDVDGGVWKQGWEITTNDNEWKETKLKVILMSHSHNDPGWVKTLDTYYQGQTRRILNTVVDALMVNEARKLVWAETIFLDIWPIQTAKQEANSHPSQAPGALPRLK